MIDSHKILYRIVFAAKRMVKGDATLTSSALRFISSMDEKIRQFLDDTQQTSTERYAILCTLRTLYQGTQPPMEESFKYGGLAYSLSKKLIGGLFSYKEHVSVEFSDGADFEDPHAVLEGGGKRRRHIKIRTQNDIETKYVAFYIQEALKAANAKG